MVCIPVLPALAARSNGAVLRLAIFLFCEEPSSTNFVTRIKHRVIAMVVEYQRISRDDGINCLMTAFDMGGMSPDRCRNLLLSLLKWDQTTWFEPESVVESQNALDVIRSAEKVLTCLENPEIVRSTALLVIDTKLDLVSEATIESAKRQLKHESASERFKKRIVRVIRPIDG